MSTSEPNYFTKYQCVFKEMGQLDRMINPVGEAGLIKGGDNGFNDFVSLHNDFCHRLRACVFLPLARSEGAKE